MLNASIYIWCIFTKDLMDSNNAYNFVEPITVVRDLGNHTHVCVAHLHGLQAECFLVIFQFGSVYFECIIIDYIASFFWTVPSPSSRDNDRDSQSSARIECMLEKDWAL